MMFFSLLINIIVLALQKGAVSQVLNHPGFGMISWLFSNCNKNSTPQFLSLYMYNFVNVLRLRCPYPLQCNEESKCGIEICLL